MRRQAVPVSAAPLIGHNGGSHKHERFDIAILTGRSERPSAGEARRSRERSLYAATGSVAVRVAVELRAGVPGPVRSGANVSYDDYQVVHGNLLEGKNLSTEGRAVP